MAKVPASAHGASALVLLLLASVPAAADPGPMASQTWYPSADASGALRIAPVGSPGTPGSVALPNGQSAVWRADEPAQVDVNFTRGTWTYSVEHNGTGRRFHIGLGHSDIGGNYTGFATGPLLDTNACAPICTGALAPGVDFVVPAGKYLAFRIHNQGDSGAPVLTVLAGDPDTWFASPAADPGYPVPELGSLLLALAGLGAVAFVASRRRA